MVQLDAWQPFLTWQFGVSCVAIMALLTAIKRFVRAIAPGFSEAATWKALLAVLNPLLGIVVAIPKGYLVGETFGQRVLTGVCAGFLSSFVYAAILKRFGVPRKEAAPAAESSSTLPPGP